MVTQTPSQQREARLNLVKHMMESTLQIICHLNNDLYLTPPADILDKDHGYGSGSCIRLGRKRFVLTNFHVIEMGSVGSVVEIRFRQSSKAYFGTVYEGTPILDLALITVDDPDFWAEAVFPEWNTTLPQTNDPVYISGYPSDMGVGHEDLIVYCFNEGVAVDTLFAPSVYVDMAQERISQIMIVVTAAVNGGNSGGLLFNAQGQAIGVPSQGVACSWNVDEIGECIPAYQVAGFLKTVCAKGRWDTSFSLGIEGFFQMVDCPSSREFWGGVLPCGVHIQVNEDLEPLGITSRDVVVAIDNRPMTRNGNMPGDTGALILSQAFTEEVGRKHEFQVEILHYKTRLIKPWVFHTKQRFYSRSYRTILREATTEYALIGGYLFFDVNYMSVHELFTHMSAGHPLIYCSEQNDGELLAEYDYHTGSEIEEDHMEELEVLNDRLLPICHDPRRKGIMVYRSIPGESTDGNAWNVVSLLNSCNGRPVKTLKTLLKHAQENRKDQPFLIIECENDRVLCIEKEEKIRTHSLPGRLNPHNIA